MRGKITLITPPDIFENSNISVLFINLSDEEQTKVSKWLSENDVEHDVNIYVYTGEPNVSWILYALSRCEYKYIDLDDQNYITQALSGYILSKNDVYYKTSDKNIASVYSHINNKKIDRVELFLESILLDKTS